jgi:BolA family transcriptional regulator, general stress-responsive regulator
MTNIEQRLRAALSITHLNITDDSAQHQNHPSSPGHAGSHLTLCVESPDFINKTPLERHRLIYAALGDLMGTVIHAIRIDAKETTHV